MNILKKYRKKRKNYHDEYHQKKKGAYPIPDSPTYLQILNGKVSYFMIKRKKGISFVCIFLMLSVAWFGFVAKLFEQTDKDRDSSIPILASEPVYHTNKVVVIDSDLIIEGLYQLENSTLKMNGNVDGDIKIEVKETGNLRLLNNSKITWGDNNKYYDFFILPEGTFYSDNSTIEYVWGEDGGGSNGLNIKSNNTLIHYSNIINCYGNGIDVTYSSPLIYNSNISTCGGNGIVIEGSNEYISEPIVTGCTINNNGDAGLRIEEYSNPYIVNNEICDNSVAGVVVNSTIFTDEKVTAFSSGFDTERLYFETGDEYNNEGSLPLTSGVRITDASINISKSSNYDSIGFEEWSLSDEEDFDEGDYDDTSFSDEYEGLILERNSSSEENNTVFYVSFDDNYTAESSHGDPSSSYSSIMNVTGYEKSAIYVENSSAYLSYSTANNIFIDNGAISFYVTRKWNNTDTFYLFTTSDDTDEYAYQDLESISMYVNEGYFYFRINGDVSLDYASLICSFNVSSWSENQWRHVQCTWGNINSDIDNSFSRVYVDGEVMASAHGTLDISALHNTMYIGSICGGSLQAHAYIDEFTLYNKTFTFYNMGKNEDSIIDFIESGTYTSKIFSTNGLARWGDISWEKEHPFNSSVVFQTRSAKDSSLSWSSWSDDLIIFSGSEIPSPMGKYFQFRVTLTANEITESTVVNNIVIRYSYNNYTMYTEDATFEEGDQTNVDIYSSPGDILTEGDLLDNNATTRFLANFDSGLTAQGLGTTTPLINENTKKVGGKLFNGTYIDETSLLSYSSTNNFYRNHGTVEFWVKPDWNSGDDREHYLFSITDDFTSDAYLDRNSFVVAVTNDSQKLRVGINDDSTDQTRYHQHEIDIDWEEDSWYFITVTWKNINSGTNNSCSNVYVNSELKSTVSEKQTNLGSIHTSMYIGQVRYGGYPAVATFDELRILSVPLTQSEVQDDYECYYPSKEYVSSVIDIDENMYWPRVAWEEELLSGTSVDVKIRTSTDNISWTGWWGPVSISTGSSLGQSPGRYMQYKITLNTTALENSSKLSEIRFIYSKHPVLVDSTFEGGTSDNVTIFDNDYIQLRTKEFAADSDTLFLAHYNDQVDADYANGSDEANSGGAEFEEGQLFQCVNVNAINSAYLDYESLDNFNQDQGTIQFWCKPDWSSSTEDDDGYLFSLSSGNTSLACDQASSFTIFTSDDCSKLNFYIRSDLPGVGAHVHSTNIDWEEGTWANIACIWGGINGGGPTAYSKLYVDGVEESSISNRNTQIVAIDPKMCIGHVRDNVCRFNGSFDELLIYDTPKSATTISSDMESQFQLYEDGGTFISDAFEMPAPGCYNTICWDSDEVEEDTETKFQIRNASSEVGLASAPWSGPTSPSDHYTFTGEYLKYNLAHDWIQYKMFVSTSSGNNTQTVREVRLLNESYPSSVSVDIGDNGDVDWEYDPTMLTPQSVSGGNVVEELNGELPHKPGTDLNVTLNITSTSGYVKLYNVSITYKGMLRFRDNLIEGSDIGLEVCYGEIMAYNNTFMENTIGVKSHLNASPILYECSIVDCSSNSLQLSDESNATLIETTFSSSTAQVNDLSSLEVKYFVNMTLMNVTTDTKVENARVRIYNITDPSGETLVYDDYSNSQGHIREDLLLSYLQTSDAVIFTLYRVLIENADDDSNQFYYVSDFNTSLNVFVDGDTDSDLISDAEEANQEILWFEAESHVEYGDEQILSDMVASGGEVVVKRHAGGAEALILDDLFPVNGSGPYKCFFKARAEDNESSLLPEEIEVDIKEDEDLLASHSFYLNTKYCWYGTDSFTLSGESVRLIFEDIQYSQSVYLDAIMLLDLSSRTEGQVSNPIVSDTDGDWIYDGLEIRDNSYWFEAEEYVNSLDKLYKDKYAYNSTSAMKNEETNVILNFSMELVSGDYVAYIRGMSTNQFPVGADNLQVDIAGYSEALFFPECYRWKKTGTFQIVSNGTYYVQLEDLDYTYKTLVDKFAIIRLDDIFEDTAYANSVGYENFVIQNDNFNQDGNNFSYELRLPGDACVTNATLTVNYTALINNFTYAPNQTRPSIWEDLAVWVEYNYTFGRDIICLYNYSKDIDSDGVPNYVDTTDTGSADTYRVNDDNDWFLDLNGIVGFQPYSEDEVWEDTNNDGIFNAGDICKYPGLDSTATTNYSLSYYGELYDEEIYGNGYDDDADGETDEDYHDPALHILTNKTKQVYRPRIHNNLIVWYYYSAFNNFDMCIYNLAIDTDSDGTPNYLDITDTGTPDTYCFDDDGDSSDTDGDGYCDGEEIMKGTNPNDPLSQPSNPTFMSFEYWVDEEILNGVDDDGDGSVDEDCRDPAMIWASNSTAHERYPDVWDGRVVYESNASDSDMEIVYDLDIHLINVTMINISNCSVDHYKITGDSDETDESHPAIYEDKVVWQDDRDGGDWDIYMTYVSRSFLEQAFFDAQISTEWCIHESNDRDDILPDNYGTTVVWQTEVPTHPANYNIRYKENYFEPDNTVKNASQKPTVTQEEPQIYGNLIVWHEQSPGLTSDIYIFEVKEEAVREVFNDAYDQEYPVVWGDRIVWQNSSVENEHIMLCGQSYIVDIGNESYDELEGTKYPFSTQTFSIPATLNNYLYQNRDEVSVMIPIRFSVNVPAFVQAFEFSVEDISIWYEFIIDPMDPDTDGDELFDGYEIVSNFGFKRIETEDAIDIHEWKHSSQNFITQTGVTLTSSNNYETDTDDGYQGSWVKMRTNVSTNGFYNVRIEPDIKVKKVVSKNYCSSMEPVILQGATWLGEGSKYSTGYTKNARHIRYDKSLHDHVFEIFNRSLIFYFRDMCGNYIPVNVLDSHINIYEVMTEDRGNFFDSDYITKGYVKLYWSFEGEMNLTNDTEYEVCVGLDLSKAWDINTGYGQLFDRIDMLQVINLDYIRLDRMGLNPMKNDTDNDGLSDGEEVYDDFYPLNDDVDDDGLSDGYEEQIGTDSTLRDTDGDMIRDGVEDGQDNAGSSMGSWIERTIINKNPYDLSYITNNDADSGTTTTDPLDVDSDGDGLPDGWIDGWLYEPFHLSEAELKTFDQEDTILSQIKIWQYNESNWKNGGEVDGTKQMFEGEDFDLDGGKNTTGSYLFSLKNFEIICSNETDSSDYDTDGDQIPDGYEVWYSQYEPILAVNDSLFLDPTTIDSHWDCDVNFTQVTDSEIINATVHRDNGEFDVAIGEADGVPTVYAVAQNFSVNANVVATKLEVYLNLGDRPNGEVYKRIGVEVWKDPGNPTGEPMDTNDPELAKAEENLLVDEVIIGDTEGWYNCDFRDRELEANQRYNLILRYLGDCTEDGNNANYTNFEWFRKTDDANYWYQELDESSNPARMKWCYEDGEYGHLNSNFSFRFYNYDYSCGDWLTNLEEYVVGTNPKNANTDNLSEPYLEFSVNISDDGLIDGQEVGAISDSDLAGGVIFRTNVRAGAKEFSYYGMEDGTTQGTDELTEWIVYDGDGEGYGALGVSLLGSNYTYEEYLTDPGSWEPCCASDLIHLFTLDDGTGMYLSPETRDNEHEYIYVWSPGCEYGSDTDDDIINGTCYVYERLAGVDMSGFEPNIDFRNQELYLANPFSIDTDFDGIKDGDELPVNNSGLLNPYSWRIEVEDSSKTEVDARICVRDSDSDNDGLEDKWSDYWNWDFDGDNYNNFADIDSDNDGLLDGAEYQPLRDKDGDGYINMRDNESDGDGLDDGVEHTPYESENGTHDVNLIYSSFPASDLIKKAAFAPNGSLFCTLIHGPFWTTSDIIWFPNNLTSFNDTMNGQIVKTLNSSVSGLKDIGVLPNGTMLYGVNKDLWALYTDFTNNTKLCSFDTSIIAFWIDEGGNVFIITEGEKLYILDKNFNVSDTEASLHVLLDSIEDARDVCVNANGDIFFIEKVGLHHQVSMLLSNYTTYNTQQNEYIKLDIYTQADGAATLRELGVDSRIIGTDDNLFAYEDIPGGGGRIVMFDSCFDREEPINIMPSMEVVYTEGINQLAALALNGQDIFFTEKDPAQYEFNKIKYSFTSMISTDTDWDGLWDGYNVGDNMGELNASHHPDQFDATYQTEEDSDSDGLIDGRECKGWDFGYHYVSQSTGEGGDFGGWVYTNSNPIDETGDTDDDGLPDRYEYRYANGSNNDTDGDGILDGTEDVDQDGRVDYGETNPLDQDTDDDRLPDGWMDGWMLQFESDEFVYKYDSFYANSSKEAWEGEDLDCDGEVDSGETDPINPDSDMDNISDGDETLFVMNVSLNWSFCNHHGVLVKSDADDDGLINALDSDSDDDGLYDWEENVDRNGYLGAIVDLENMVLLSDNISCWSKDDWKNCTSSPSSRTLPLPSDNGTKKNVACTMWVVNNTYYAKFTSSDVMVETGVLYISTKDMSDDEYMEFQFGDDLGINVDGCLRVFGNESTNPVWPKVNFTNDGSETWAGISFNESSYNNYLSYCTVTYGKNEYVTNKNFSIRADSRTIISNCTINGSSLENTTGILLRAEEVRVECSDISNYNYSHNHYESGICLEYEAGDDVDVVIAGNRLNNNYDGIYYNTSGGATQPFMLNITCNEIRNCCQGIYFTADTIGENITWTYNNSNGQDQVNCLNNNTGTFNISYTISPKDIMNHPNFYAAWETNPYYDDSDYDEIKDPDDLYNYLAENEPQWNVDNEGDFLINAMDTDSDDDGSLDGVEDYNENDPTSELNWNGKYNKDNRETNPLMADSDSDGIKDGVESFWGTDPQIADTDGDGLNDGEELLWCFDFDGDGKINALDRDSDNDGVNDGVEMGVSGEDSDPTTITSMINIDCDNDGLMDGEEDSNGNGQVDGDTNLNGLIDGLEEWYESAPTDLDSDDDGVTDDDEGTLYDDHDNDGLMNIVDYDSDNDGIIDGIEKGYTVGNITYHTNLSAGVWQPDADPTTTTGPLDADSDDDGIPDGCFDKDDSGTIENDETEDYDCDGMVDGDTDLDGEMDWGEDTNYNGVLDSEEDEDGILEKTEDANNDGILDREYWTETNPLDADSDDDNLTDGLELGLDRTNSPVESDTNSSVVKYDADPRSTTDPLHMDSDADGLPDGWIDTWGYDEENGTWRKGISTLGGYQTVEYEDKDLNGAIGGDDNANGEWESWETWNETSPNNPDTDNDSAPDGVERDGWWVIIFYERNPEPYDKKYKVTSNPLKGDTDIDGVTDGDEMILGGDPNKADTDEDGHLDGNEEEYGSTLGGKECGLPSTDISVNTCMEIKNRYYNTWLGKIWCGWKLVTTVTVEVSAIDVSGIQDISVKVQSSGLLGSKQKTKTQEGGHFKPRDFSFTFGLDSLLCEVWTGWNVYVDTTDNNGNIRKDVHHIKSGVEVLLDKCLDFLEWLYELALEALKEIVERSYDYALGWFKNGAKSEFNSIVSDGADLFRGSDTNQTRDTDFLDTIGSVLNSIFSPIEELLNVFTKFVNWAVDFLEPVLDKLWDWLSWLFKKGINFIKNLFMPDGYEDVEVSQAQQDEMMSEIEDLSNSKSSINKYIMEKLRSPMELNSRSLMSKHPDNRPELNHLRSTPGTDDYAVLLCTQNDWNDAEQFEEVLTDYQIVKLKGDAATSTNLRLTMEKLIYMCGDNDNVVINIASHGLPGSFILNDGVISYKWLDDWLDKIPAKITVIIDSCYSGSARDFLTQRGREVYTACGADELSTGEYDRRFAEALDIPEADVDGDGVVEMWEADRWGRKVRVSLDDNDNKYIEFRIDSDGDGFENSMENDTTFWNALGVPTDEFPDWQIPDIYVEVDWMEDSIDYWQVVISIALFLIGIALAVLGIILTPAFGIGVPIALMGIFIMIVAIEVFILSFNDYSFSNEAQKEVKDFFKDAPNGEIRLHIDDGCMGGGTEIPYKEKISGEEPYRDDPEYHSTDRHHIFHYVVICNELNSESSGMGWPGGLSFVIAYETSTNFIKSFVHELGHNILGDGSANAPYGNHRDGSGHHPFAWWEDAYCAMYGSSTLWGCHDYCSDCWDALNLSYCHSNYAGRI